MRIAIAATTAEQIDAFRRAFDIPDAHGTTEPGRALELLSTDPDLVVVDAAAAWALSVVGLLPEEGPAVLVAASDGAREMIPSLVRAGADGSVRIPASARDTALAIASALQARERRIERFQTLTDTRRQLQRFADDFRVSYQRERDQASIIADTVTRLERSYAQTVRALANAVEAKDPTTGRHLERVTANALALTRTIDPDLAEEPHLSFAYLLHDVGKIGIPDRILLKGGILTVDERRLVQQHPGIGASIVEGIGFLAPVQDVIRHHHERWDGRGYPDRLAGEDIPRAARIFAVVDAADAMLHDRPYRLALPAEEAHARLRLGAGAQFDPEVVEAYMELFGARERAEAEVAH